MHGTLITVLRKLPRDSVRPTEEIDNTIEAKRIKRRAITARYRAKHLKKEQERCLIKNRIYRATNNEELNARRRALRAADPAKARAKEKHQRTALGGDIYRYKDPEKRKTQHGLYAAKYRAAHHEEILLRERTKGGTYRAAHAEENRARTAAWREAHPGAATAWFKANPEKRSSYGKRRRARKNNAPVNDLTATQWEEIKAAYSHRCVYCGRKMQRLTQDHITPLSKGGSHTKSNVVPACRSCNSKKHTGPPLKPIQPLLL